MSRKTWGGRFADSTDARVEEFTESISVDCRLWRHDILGSQAHARMLAKIGLLTEVEATEIVTALDEIGKDIEAGRLLYSTALEDIHTHIEQSLIAKLGDLGRKLHSGRSRNDQIATDLKLWTRETLDDIDVRLRDLQFAFVDSAIREEGVILPGYTHLQRAQPILASHYFLAYVEKFQRDRERLHDCRRRLNWLPLGAAALAGTSLPIDRDFVAAALGFSGVARNSLDISSDRDFVVEFVFCLSLLAAHLSGWADEWVLWSTTEFDFLQLPDAFCTGSSIMPQKRNPDVLELIRGKSARVIASLQHLLVLLKGLPLAYNRDLQEDKLPLFQAADTVLAMLKVAAPLIRSTRLKHDSINARLDQGFLDATTLMEALVLHGMPIRTAHEAVGKLVRVAESKRCRLSDLPESEWNSIAPGFRPALGVDNAIAAFRSYGSTAPAEVAKQIQFWRTELARQA